MFLIHYSYARASIGWSLDAFLAGMKPEINPIMNENARPSKINSGVTTEGIPKLVMPADKIKLKAIPITPPTNPIIPASKRNKSSTSLFFIPMAFKIPMYLVCSRTLINMVFATPMPPTIKEIDAIPPRKRERVSVMLEIVD